MTTYALTRPSTRPGGSRIGYWLAALVAIGGIVLATGYGAVAAWDAWRSPDAFDRTVLGGQLAVELAAGDEAVVYVEADGTPSLAALRLTVDSPTGEQVAVAAYPSVLRYDRGEILATAVGRFGAPSGGTYEVRSDDAGLAGALAVGPDIGARLADALALAGLIAAIGIVLCAAIAITASVVARPATSSR
jgi:hypothetical protein